MSAKAPNEQQQAIITAPMDVPLKVIAGAGTGKTHTLTARFLWLVEQGIAPDQILAITFTDKAAAEMAARIRGALAREGRPVERALAIHTFHAFAGRLLRTHPEASGLPSDFTVLSEVPQALLLRRVFNDATAGRLDVDGLRLDDLAALDVAALEDIRRVARSIISRAKGNRWTPEAFEARAREADARFFAALPTRADAERTGAGKGKLTEQIHRQMEAAGFPCRAWTTCRGATQEPDIRRLYFPKLREATSLFADFDAQISEQRRSSDAALQTIVALFREYNRRLDGMGALDFDDLILRAVQMLETRADVREATRNACRYILVDEFQDTSPAQMDLIRAIARSAPCPESCAHRSDACTTHRPVNVTIVGDKKQAIYAWRNARKENLDQLIPCMGEDVCRPLAVNYRSAGAVIALANAIATRVEPSDPHLEAQRTETGHIHIPQLFGNGKAKENRQDEATYIAERIQAIVGAGARYGDVAVLIRKISQFHDLREAFRRRNIPYVCDNAGGLLDEPMAKDVLAVLRAVARPHDNAALYRLLSRAPLAISDADLVDLCHQDNPAPGGTRRTLEDAVNDAEEGAAATLRERLSALRREAVRLPPPAFLEALPALAGFDGGWDEDDRALWPQALALLQAVAAEAEQMAPAAAVEELLDLLDAYADEDTSGLGNPPTEAEGVRVMTIHKAKGLEFPVVFVPSIASARKSEPGWGWDDDWGLLPDFAEAQTVKRTVAMWLRRQRDIAEDEEDRCWYVAATRARDWMCVTGIEVGSQAAIGKTRGNTLPADVAALPREDYDPADWDTRLTVRRRAEGEAPSLSPAPPAGAGMGVARTVSFSALSVFRTCDVAWWIRRVWRIPDGLSPQGNGSGGGMGRRVGDLFHLCAARWYAEDREGLPDALFAPDDAEDVRESVRRRWERFLSSPVAAWAPQSVERHIRYRHATEHGPLDMSGYIDLVLPCEGEGVTLADLKTNRRLDAATRDLYATQLALYRIALTADGERVSPTGILVHVTPEGAHPISVSLPEHEAPVRALLDAYANTIRRGKMPQRPDHADCNRCAYRPLCPRAAPEGAPGAA